MDKRQLIRLQNRLRTKKRRLIEKVRNQMISKSDSDTDDIDEAFQQSVPHEIISDNPFLIESADDEQETEFREIIEESTASEEHLSSEDTVGEDSSSSEDSESDLDSPVEENELENKTEVEKLRTWAVEGNILQNQLDKLLDILRPRLMPSLPKSAKTFLGTSQAEYKIEEIQNSDGGKGSFVYFGIVSGLQRCVNETLHKNRKIEIQIHADEAPVSKSGTEHIWIIAGKVHFDPDIYKPFIIALYDGEGKPKSSEIFLRRFITEMNALQENGLEVNGKHFGVNLKCVIADTPARAFLKNTVGHTAIFACERCTVQGVRIESTTVYASIESEERTDDSFRDFQQPEHHHGPSAFLRVIPFLNMIAIFVLDFMHLCCQGIMKQLIQYWMSGDLNFKLSVRNRAVLTNRLRHIRCQVPTEFQRKTRSIQSYLKWKATELRFFLLYCGPIVLKDLLRDDLYKHFLLLHSACRILCCSRICTKYARQAKQYLTSFFFALKDFYGEKSQVLNAHHLIHLADDVTHLNCNLSLITAFPFENLLGQIQRFLRTPYRRLAQLCRRLHERSFLKDERVLLPPLVEVLKITRNDKIKEIKYKNFFLTTTSPNNLMLLDNDQIMKVTKIFGDIKTPKLLQVEGRIWGKKRSLFTYPCDSEKLQTWQLNEKASRTIVTYPITSIKNKMINLSVKKDNGIEKFYAVGMLH